MNKLFCIVVSALLSTVSYADQIAITDTGDEVILNSDGTWEYMNGASDEVVAVETNPEKFEKTADSTFLLKSKKNNSAYWVNTKKWSFKKAVDNGEAEYELQLKGQDLYGMVVSEGIPIPMESLAEIALENAKGVAPNMKVLNKEYRYVNGNKVIYMEMSGTMQGIEITYFGHYYSDSHGATQLVAYTGTNLVEKHRAEITDFLNGLAEQ